jgi:hypothetical protein
VIRVIVFAVIGLVLGLGGGSGVAVMRAKKTAVQTADSTDRKDAAVGEEKHGAETKATSPEGSERTAASQDSSGALAHAEPARHDSVTAAPPVAPHVPAAALAASAPAPTNGAAKPVTADTSRSGATAPGRIAKIFAAMSAKDAARVLQQLDDADVQTVLGGLNDKQAAAILSGFPPERAAAISRAALRGKKGAS